MKMNVGISTIVVWALTIIYSICYSRNNPDRGLEDMKLPGVLIKEHVEIPGINKK